MKTISIVTKIVSTFSLFAISVLGADSKFGPGVYGLGTSWSIGGTAASAPTIVRASTTFNPGTPPQGQLGQLILWPGLSNGTGDLLQTTAESWPDQSWCGGVLGQWCIRTSVFSKQQEHDGAYAPLNANEPLTIEFARSADGKSWTQTATVAGTIVSQLTSSSGPMTVFGLATQCDCYCAGSVSSQVYTNTTIELAVAAPSWGTSSIIGEGAYGDGTGDDADMGQTQVASSPTSADGGKTWTIAQITIPPM